MLNDSIISSKNCLIHLCSKNHINKVYSFFRQNGTNQKQIDPKWFYVGQPFKNEVNLLLFLFIDSI